jgi:hypothetical protein
VIAAGMHLSDPVSSYTWDISGLANGTYYVHATIDDGTTAVSAYAAGPLVIDRTVSLTITATAGAGGSITPSGTIVISNGSSQTFTIIPDSGYRVQSVLVDGADQGAITSYTFQNVTTSHRDERIHIPVRLLLRESGGQRLLHDHAEQRLPGAGRTGRRA